MSVTSKQPMSTMRFLLIFITFAANLIFALPERSMVVHDVKVSYKILSSAINAISFEVYDVDGGATYNCQLLEKAYKDEFVSQREMHFNTEPQIVTTYIFIFSCSTSPTDSFFLLLTDQMHSFT